MRSILKGINSFIDFTKFQGVNHNLSLEVQKELFKKDSSLFMCATEEVFLANSRAVNKNKSVNIKLEDKSYTYYSIADTAVIDKKRDILKNRIIKEDYLKKGIFSIIKKENLVDYAKMLDYMLRRDLKKIAYVRESSSELLIAALEQKIALSENRLYYYDINKAKVFNVYQNITSLSDAELEGYFKALNKAIRLGVENLIISTQKFYLKEKKEKEYEAERKTSDVQVSKLLRLREKEDVKRREREYGRGDDKSTKSSSRKEAESASSSELRGEGRGDSEARSTGSKGFTDDRSHIRGGETFISSGAGAAEAASSLGGQETLGRYDELRAEDERKGRGGKSSSDERYAAYGDGKTANRYGKELLDEILNVTLRFGGNFEGGRLKIVSEFSKGKEIEQQAQFLKDTFKGFNGFFAFDEKISVIYKEDGIYFLMDKKGDDKSFNLLLNWSDVAKKINEMLSKSTYASKEELLQAEDFERKQIASFLWYLRQDLSDEAVAKNYLSQVKREMGYEKDVIALSSELAKEDSRLNILNEYEAFLKEYKKDNNLLRFQFHNLDNIHIMLKDLNIKRKEYFSIIDDVAEPKEYITENEILSVFKRGGSYTDSKMRIYNFFSENENMSDKAEFLSKEYGLSGASSNKTAGYMANGKGIKIEKQKCEPVFLKWSKAAKYVDRLIENEEYIDLSKILKDETYEEKEKIKEDIENKYYSKENPSILITDEMLKRVPKLYKQEKTALADMTVHAAYFIPFKSNWTWYMTEYDKESGNAFGLVLGLEAEWGYFNVNELEKLNAQRLVLEDFPKTFRELKDSELKRQMDEHELNKVFNGQLTFDEDEGLLDEKDESHASEYAKSNIENTEPLQNELDKDAQGKEIFVGLCKEVTKGSKYIKVRAGELLSLGVSVVKIEDKVLVENFKEGDIYLLANEDDEHKIDEFVLKNNIRANYLYPSLKDRNLDDTFALTFSTKEFVILKAEDLKGFSAVKTDKLVEVDEKDYSVYTCKIKDEEHILKKLNAPILFTEKDYLVDMSLENIRNVYNSFREKNNLNPLKRGEFLENMKNLPLYSKDNFAGADIYFAATYDAEDSIFFFEATKGDLTFKNEIAYSKNAALDILMQIENSDEYFDEQYVSIYADDIHKVQSLIDENAWDALDNLLASINAKVILNSDAALKRDKKSKEKQDFSFNEQNEDENTFTKEYIVDLAEKNYIAKTKKDRALANIQAIEALKVFEEDEDIKEPDIATLKSFSGFGGMFELFDERDESYEKERVRLKELLTDDEYKSAAESSLSAYYTDSYIIKAIYDVVNHIGLKSDAAILEPSCGMGRFLDDMPSRLKRTSSITAVELDSLSSRITKAIYNKEKNVSVINSGYENVDFRGDKFDLIISNIPFGEMSISDSKYEHNYLIHDYFFIKSLDNLKEGGIIAFITSNGTLDKRRSIIRDEIAKKAEFLGAIRLANTAFKSSGAFVTTDIIFLRKSSNPKLINEFTKLKVDDKGLLYNEYFVNNPKMIAGEIVQKTNRFGRSLPVCAEIKYGYENSSKNVAASLYEAVSALKEDISRRALDVLPVKENEAEGSKLSNKTLQPEHKIAEPYVAVLEAKDDEKRAKDFDKISDYVNSLENFSLFEYEGELFFKEDAYNIQKQEYEGRFAKRYTEAAKLYIKIRDELINIIELSKVRDDEDTLSDELFSINKKVDKFALKYKSFDKVYQAIYMDSNFPLVASIGKLDKDKNIVDRADILKRRIIFKEKKLYAENAKDSLMLSLNEKGDIDFGFMSSLTGLSEKELIADLKGEIMIDTKNNMDKYILKDEYLSGNVKARLKRLKNRLLYIESELSDEDLLENKRESLILLKDRIEKELPLLEDVIPKDIAAEDIFFSLSSNFIDIKHKIDFVNETFHTRGYADITYNKAINTYETSNVYPGSYEVTQKFSSRRSSASDIFLRCLNQNTKPVIKEGKIDKAETLTIELKMKAFEDSFKDFMLKDKERRESLVREYNDKFNCHVLRKYSGDHLTFKGMSSEITLKKHQKDAIARVLYGGNSLLAHCVGAGKTFEMIASIMEGKRMGISKKSMMVVPNHLVRQTSSEFLNLYPQAKILAVDPKMDLKNEIARKRFIGQIMHSDCDCIIVTHNQFEKFPMSDEYVKSFLQREIDKLNNYLMFGEDKHYQNKKTKRNILLTIKSYENKLKKISEKGKKDIFINFEDMGVDRIFVDEAHAFKNLETATKFANVSGISSSGSLRSFDMYMKTSYLNELTNERGVVFATATPVTNSITEMYTMKKYLQPSILQENDLTHFDAWLATFAKSKKDSEISIDGKNFKMRERFTFHNVQELVKIFNSFADIKTKDMLNLPLPKVKYHLVESEASYYQKQMLSEITQRCDDISSGVTDAYEDNMLKVTGDGKKLALDHRLVCESLPDLTNSKVNMLCKNVYAIYEQSKAQQGCQLIFSDLSTPSAGFNLYDDIKSKLIAMGIAEDEIAFIHDAKNQNQKESLFENVREGNIRILLGSTQKLGTGTNVQNKLVASHDFDVPWRPSDLEQRAGRIERQGNLNEEAHIFRYITKGTLDSYLWQTIEKKQDFIDKIMTNRATVRDMEDLSEDVLSASEIKALATGNPLMQEKVSLDSDIARLKILKKTFLKDMFEKESKLSTYPDLISEDKRFLDAIEKDISHLDDVSKDTGSDFKITLAGESISDRKKAIELLRVEYNTLNTNSERVIGQYKGFDIKIKNSFGSTSYELMLNHKYYADFNSDNLILNRLEKALDIERIRGIRDNIDARRKLREDEFLAISKEDFKTFAKEDELLEKERRLKELVYEIKENAKAQKDDIAPSNYFGMNKDMPKSDGISLTKDIKTDIEV